MLHNDESEVDKIYMTGTWSEIDLFCTWDFFEELSPLIIYFLKNIFGKFIFSKRESVCNFLPRDLYENTCIISFKNILIKHALPIDFSVKFWVKSNTNQNSENSYGGLYLFVAPFKLIPCL